MPQEYLRAVLQEDQKVNQLFTFLGARVASAKTGTARVLLPVSSKLAQGGAVSDYAQGAPAAYLALR